MISTAKYYDIQRILKKDADYNVIYGKRSNGKTFGACEVCLTSHINNGARMAYIRRYAEEIAPKRISNLFTPHPIERITEGNYNCTLYKSHRFYLARADPNGEITDKEQIPFCQTFALNTWERDKGADNGQFDYIVLDEFITRGQYLPNEFILFCNILSSLMRDRAGTKIFLLGNTTSEYLCPYFEEMGIQNIIDTLEQGDIKTTRTREGLKIAIEYCEDSENTKKINKYFSFNNPRLDMITSGKWEMKNYPHPKMSIHNDDIIARVFIDSQRCIVGDICNVNDDLFILFHAGQKSEYDDKRHYIISDTPLMTPYAATCLYNPRTRVHTLFLDLVNAQKMFFTTNAIGEQVRAWIAHERQMKSIFIN